MFTALLLIGMLKGYQEMRGKGGEIAELECQKGQFGVLCSLLNDILKSE